MKIYSVINQKGGVGKTTTAVNLSYGFASQGKKTLLVDLDPQSHSTVIYGDPHSEFTVGDILLDKGFKIKKSIYAAKIQGESIENLDIMPSNIRLAVAAEQVSTRMHREKILYNALQKFKKDYEYVLIDCPPTLGVLAVNGIYAADEFIIPITYSRYSLDGVADLFSIIEEVKEGKNFKYRIVKNTYDSRTTHTNKAVEEQLVPVNDNVMETVIRKTETINQAAMNGEPVFTFDPKGNGAKDFMALTREVLNG